MLKINIMSSKMRVVQNLEKKNKICRRLLKSIGAYVHCTLQAAYTVTKKKPLQR